MGVMHRFGATPILSQIDPIRRATVAGGGRLIEINVLRERRREVPLGSDMVGRLFSTDLLRVSDAELLKYWDHAADRRSKGKLA